MNRTVVLLAVLCASAPLPAQYTRPSGERPRLVVFLTVDQLRPDYLDRWATQLTSGLGRIRVCGCGYGRS